MDIFTYSGHSVFEVPGGAPGAPVLNLSSLFRRKAAPRPAPPPAPGGKAGELSRDYVGGRFGGGVQMDSRNPRPEDVLYSAFDGPTFETTPEELEDISAGLGLNGRPAGLHIFGDGTYIARDGKGEDVPYLATVRAHEEGHALSGDKDDGVAHRRGHRVVREVVTAYRALMERSDAELETLERNPYTLKGIGRAALAFYLEAREKGARGRAALDAGWSGVKEFVRMYEGIGERQRWLEPSRN